MAKQRGMMLPIIASVGIGAAAYYSMKRGNGVGSMAQQMMPGMGGQSQGQQNQKS